MSSELDEAVISEWFATSSVLYASIIAVTAVTLPLLAFSLLSLSTHRKSHYFVCLVGVLAGNAVLLAAICMSVLVERAPFLHSILHGSLLCQSTAFIVNASSCFIHWTWVVMYLQRCVCVFFPMRARRRTCLSRGSQPVFGVLVFSLLSQLWTPLLFTEVSIASEEGTVTGTICGSDQRNRVLQLVAVAECSLTFFLPFLLTVLTDISVLILRQPCAPSFLLVPAEEVGDGQQTTPTTTKTTPTIDSIKIMSRKSIACSQRRRHSAIRRCLLMASINLLLNLPNYSLQVLDELFDLKSGSSKDQLFFIRVDAIAYILYLLQFPLVPVYVYLLRADITRGSTKSKIKREYDLSPYRSSLL